MERECLAVVKSIQHFDVYLSGVPFTVKTDHQCLRFMSTLKNQSGRLQRWGLQLQPYKFDVVYRPGSQNDNADGLSRQAYDSAPTDDRMCRDEIPGFHPLPGEGAVLRIKSPGKEP